MEEFGLDEVATATSSFETLRESPIVGQAIEANKSNLHLVVIAATL